MTIIFEPSAHDKTTLALRDAANALSHWRLWTMMGWHDILKRYRRSVLGPFWLTLSMAFTVACLSVIYGTLLRMPLNVYVPFLSVGLAIWTFVSTTIIEGCFGFLDHEGLIKNIKMPIMMHALRVVWRNLIILFHNIVIYFVVMIIFGSWPGPAALLALPGLLLLTINLSWMSLFLGIVCTRFRDVSQIVGSLSQLLFFITPVMWSPDLLTSHQWAVDINPLYHTLQTIRSPLLGVTPSLISWAVTAGVAVVGWLLTFRLFIFSRSRVVYWL